MQKRIESNKHKKSKKRLDDIQFLLSGKAYDGNCGGAFIGDSGTSRNGETYYYYTCQNKKAKKGCKTKSVKKKWFEDIIVEATKRIVLDDKLIESIGNRITELQEKNVDKTMLQVAQKELQHVESSIKNILNAIEQGIITDTTKERLLELEARQAQLQSEVKIETLKIKAPKVKKEQVIFWLEQFREGNTNKESYKKQIIDTFVNTVVLYDDVVTIAYNYANNEIVDIPLKKLKNSSDSVRMSLINWRIGDSNS
ncbi:MAG: zinc ribbon domain-containing protein [Candidatus Gastranaerophilales bacterium]|nr:zinc ribbon domain-containing protein [Candidatus Gastranaerophilales bacterium]